MNKKLFVSAMHSCSLVVLLNCVAIPAFADVISYPDFSNPVGLSKSGYSVFTTTSDGTVARLINASGNENGALYNTTGFTLGANNTFSSTFKFRFTNPGGIDPADGITFVIASSPAGLGSAGYGMGYETVANSVAIEFDTYNNGNPDSYGSFSNEPNSSNHVALDLNGVLTNQAATNVYGNGSCGFSGPNAHPAQDSYTAPGCMSNGDLWTVNIGYDGSLLNVSLFDPAEGYTFNALTNYSIDLSSYLISNTAYLGFTASSGAGWENEDIVQWSYANTTVLAPPPPATAVPEPFTLSLFGAGLAGAAAMRRRKKKA